MKLWIETFEEDGKRISELKNAAIYIIFSIGFFLGFLLGAMI